MSLQVWWPLKHQNSPQKITSHLKEWEKDADIRDISTHKQLMKDLVEHIWQRSRASRNISWVCDIIYVIYFIYLCPSKQSLWYHIYNIFYIYVVMGLVDHISHSCIHFTNTCGHTIAGALDHHIMLAVNVMDDLRNCEMKLCTGSPSFFKKLWNETVHWESQFRSPVSLSWDDVASLEIAVWNSALGLALIRISAIACLIDAIRLIASQCVKFN